MPWTPLPQLLFAICTYPFVPSSPLDLPLQIGDELYIIEQGGQDGAWYRGYLVAPPSLLSGLTSTKGQTLEKRVFTGIFPRCCVEVRELLGDVSNHSRLSRRVSQARIAHNDLHAKTKSTSSLSDRGSATPSLHSQEPPGIANEPGTDGYPPDQSRTDTEDADGNQPASERHRPNPTADVHRDSKITKPVAPVPMLKIGDESVLAKEEPLVDEIASCLREWHSSSLHELLLSRRYQELEQLSALVTRLDYARRQLLHSILTRHELDLLRESAVWDLVNGNKILGGGTVVRSTQSKGRTLTSDDSAIEISQLQSVMSLLNEKPASSFERSSLYHVMVDLQSFVLDAAKSTTLCLSLYRKVSGQPPSLITESYVAEVPFREPDGFVFDGPAKTLFSDIGSADLGEAPNNNPKIYLVARVISKEPTSSSESATSDSPTSSEGHSRQASSTASSTWRTTSTKAGRRSLMWNHIARKDSQIVPQGQSRPDTAQTRTSDIRPNTAASQDRKAQRPVKRLVGLGILEIGGRIRTLQDLEPQVDVKPLRLTQDSGDDEEEAQFWNELVSQVFKAGPSHGKESLRACALSLRIKSFRSPSSSTLIQSTPTSLYGVTDSRRIGFSGAPTTPRNDIYLSIASPSILRNAYLSHPRTGGQPVPSESGLDNLQLTLEVRNLSGQRIENCIFPSSNSQGHTAWRTVAAGRNEAWNQTVRLAISPDLVPGSHVVMSIADAPDFPFALCWIPLWNQEAFIRDGEHSLALYKYDEHTSSMISGKGAYLSLPWSSSKANIVTGPIAAVTVSTFLCSTAYSQDSNLLGLLKWRENRSKDIGEILRQFPFVPDIEIVKLINEVLDSLFEALVEISGKEETEDLIFNALVIVLGIVNDRRFHLQSLVDDYIESRFKWPFAFPCLFRSFTRLIKDPTGQENARKLRAAFKVGAFIFKFIIRARQQQIGKEVDIGIKSHPPTFAKDLRGIFVATEELMRNPNPVLVGTKTIVVQNFHTYIPQLSGVTSSQEVLHLVTGLIDASSDAQGKLILYRLVLIRNLSEFFRIEEIQDTWRIKVSEWLAPYWGSFTSPDSQTQDQIRLCCSVISTFVNDYGNQGSAWFGKLVDSYKTMQMLSHGPKNTLSMLFPTSYPFPSRPTTSPERYEEALIELAALLAVFAGESANIFTDVSTKALPDLIFDVLNVFRSVLNSDAFPPSWLSLQIYHHKSVYRILESIFDILSTRFLPSPDDADNFNDELWKSYLSVAILLVSSDALALETFPEQKRRAVWKIGGDVRELGAALLQRSWDVLGWETTREEKHRFGLTKMGGFQVPYVPGLVGPILELCLSVHEGLRNVATGILKTMIVGEWTLSEDLNAIQAEMIDKMDKLYREKPLNDGMLQKQFIDELDSLTTTPNGVVKDMFHHSVAELLKTMSELLDLLIAVHVPEASGDSSQAYDTLRLLEYLKHMNKGDIYVGYIHKLSKVHRDAAHYAEAALALKMHADLYEWDPKMTLDAMDEPVFPKQSAFERKEHLYFEMIECFEEARDWQQALQSYRDLALQYEQKLFDFAKLARTQRSMASIYEKVNSEERQNPRFFRVVFRGLGFQSNLRDKQFIFEGSANDRVSSFTDRMQQQYPSAQVVSGGPLDEIEGQYLSIYSVSAQRDFSHPVNRRPKTSQSIKDYFSLASPRTFVVTSRRQGSGGAIKDQVQDKIVYTTAETFPTVLRRSEIVSTETIRMSPVQIGLDRATRKTQDLSHIMNSVLEGRESALQSLTETLMLLVNRGSAASVAGYWDLVARPKDHLDESETKPQERDNHLEEALRVALIDHVYAIRRCLDLYTRSAHQATKAELLKDLQHTFATILAVIEPDSEKQSIPEIAEPKQASTSRSQQGSRQADRAPAQYSLYPRDAKPKTSERDKTNRETRSTEKSSASKGKDAPNHRHETQASRVTSRLSSLYRREPGDPKAANGISSRPNGDPEESSLVNRQASIQNLQARMGSVTKRLSTLNMNMGRNKGAKSSPRSPNFETVPER